MRAYVKALVRDLPRVGEDVTLRLLTPDWNADFGGDDERVRIVPLPRVPHSRTRRVVYQQLQLPEAIRREQLDVFLALATVAPLRMPVPYVLVVQFLQFYEFPDAYGRGRSAYLKWLLPKSVANARRVIVFTHFQKQQLLAHVRCDPARILVVPHGLALDSLATPANDADRAAIRNLTGDRPYIFYASATYGYKNHLNLIAAFAALKRQRPEWRHRLLLAGSEQSVSFEVLRARAAAFGVGADVIVAGRLANLAAAYQMADAFAFPSRAETFGFPSLEAMAAGCPVVASDRGAIAELAGPAAVLADPDQPQAFANALERVLADASLRDTLVARGRTHAAQFTWERTATLTLRALQEAAQSER